MSNFAQEYVVRPLNPTLCQAGCGRAATHSLVIGRSWFLCEPCMRQYQSDLRSQGWNVSWEGKERLINPLPLRELKKTLNLSPTEARQNALALGEWETAAGYENPQETAKKSAAVKSIQASLRDKTVVDISTQFTPEVVSVDTWTEFYAAFKAALPWEKVSRTLICVDAVKYRVWKGHLQKEVVKSIIIGHVESGEKGSPADLTAHEEKWENIKYDPEFGEKVLLIIQRTRKIGRSGIPGCWITEIKD